MPWDGGLPMAFSSSSRLISTGSIGRQARTAHDERAMRRIEAVSSALEPAKRPRSGGDEQDEEEQERVDRPAEHFAGVEIEARRRLLGADRLPVGKAPALCAPPRLL